MHRLLTPIWLVLLTLIGCGCGDDPRTPPAAPPATNATAGTGPDGRALRYLALGDSYTKGEGVPAAARWPVQLAAKLREAGHEVADPVIIAETGWRTDDLRAALDAAEPKGPFQLVSLLIGVNNQHQGRSADDYGPEFDALLRRAVTLAGGEPSRVLVLSIPDYGATPYGRANDPAAIAAGIDAFNGVNRELSQRAGVRYVDVTPVSKRAADEPDLTISDDLHPSAKMYAEWAALALPQAQAALASASAKGGGVAEQQ